MCLSVIQIRIVMKPRQNSRNLLNIQRWAVILQSRLMAARFAVGKVCSSQPIVEMNFLENIHGCYFENYQENGTKYLKNSRPLPVSILEDLLQCAGEIYLSGIPENVTAERVASVACLLGEMYLLRFKVNFAGLSRGFAYMQYVNPGLMNLAIQRLPELFRLNGLAQIRVRQSKNCSKLVLRNVFQMSPQSVEQTLIKMVNFRQINARRLHGDKYEYQIVFGSNDDAVRARRVIISNIYAFGQSAMVTWDRVHAK